MDDPVLPHSHKHVRKVSLNKQRLLARMGRGQWAQQGSFKEHVQHNLLYSNKLFCILDILRAYLNTEQKGSCCLTLIQNIETRYKQGTKTKSGDKYQGI